MLHKNLPALLFLLLIMTGAVKGLAQSPVLTQSNLPIIIITTPNATSVPNKNQDAITASMKVIYNGAGKINHITDTAYNYNGAIQIRARGNSSAYYPQTPYAVTTVDAAGDDIDVPLLGMPAEEDWVLISLYNDKSFMRNLLAYKMSTEMGEYASRSSLCEVVLNGDYVGVYVFGEKVTQGKQRVNITKMSTSAATGAAVTGGYIFKVDDWDSTSSWASDFPPVDLPNGVIRFSYEYPKSSKITTAQKTYIRGYVDSFQSVLAGPNVHDPISGYRKFIDPTTFADYGIVNEVARNPDGFKKSYYFYKDNDAVDSRIKNVPVWDFDWAYKIIASQDIYADTTGAGWAYNVNSYPNLDVVSPGWMVNLMHDCDFVNLFHDRYKNFRSNILGTKRLFSYIDSMANVLTVDSAATRHFQRWQTLGVEGPTPQPGPYPTTYQGEVNALKSFLTMRLGWLDVNIPSCHGSPIVDSNFVTIYPNPASKEFYIDFSSAAVNHEQQSFTVVIYDMMGNVKSRQVVNSLREQVISVAELQTGIYYVRIFIQDSAGKLVDSYAKKLVIHQ